MLGMRDNPEKNPILLGLQSAAREPLEGGNHNKEGRGREGMSPKLVWQQHEDKAGVLTQLGNCHQQKACKNKAQLLSKRIEQLEKAADDRNNSDMASSQAAASSKSQSQE